MRILLSTMVTTAAAMGMWGCGGGNADADEGISPPMPEIDYKTEFVPGNPNFKRPTWLDVDNQSATDDLRSHNPGESCMKCHQEHGPGKGRFSLSGTFYTPDNKPFPNAVLKLFARADVTDGGATVLSDEVFSLPVDGRGNFYTTAPLPGGYPRNKLYPRFFGPNGEPLIGPDNVNFAQMNGGVTMGSCNFCHGSPNRVRGQIP